jgi:hypothetical protein
LLIPADDGGRNGHRPRQWKARLQDASPGSRSQSTHKAPSRPGSPGGLDRSSAPRKAVALTSAREAFSVRRLGSEVGLPVRPQFSARRQCQRRAPHWRESVGRPGSQGFHSDRPSVFRHSAARSGLPQAT